MKINDSKLSRKIINIMRHAGIETIAQLKSKSEIELREIRNIGDDAISEIAIYFKQENINWKNQHKGK